MQIFLIIAGIILGILFVIFVLPKLLIILFWILAIGGGAYLVYRVARFLINRSIQKAKIETETQNKINTWLQGKFCYDDIANSEPYDEDEEDYDDDFDDDDYDFEDDDYDDDYD